VCHRYKCDLSWNVSFSLGGNWREQNRLAGSAGCYLYDFHLKIDEIALTEESQ
jgi:hypothetical protein